MSIIIQFRAATQHLRECNVAINDKMRWKLYGLSKQATDGDNKTVLPALNETVTRAKWDAWNSCRGMSVDKAMQAYVEEVEKIDPSFKASEVKEDGVKASMFTHNEKIVKEGSLFEQKDIFVSWRPRYIILHKTFLHFCMDPSDHIPLNTMDLIGCTVTPVKPSKIGDKEIFPFVISHPHSTVTHNMASESQEAADDWIQTIRSVSSSSPSTSLMPSTITADDRILNRRPMEDDDERQQYQEEQAAKGRPLPAETVAPEITNRNIPPKYAPKVKKAIDLLVDWTSPGAENWTPLFEKDGIKAFTRVDKKVPCVFSEGVVGYPIHDVFRLLIANKRFTELDMQLYTNKRLKTFSINTTVEYLRWKQVWPLSARDMCNLFHWRLLKDGSIVAIQFSEKFDDVTSLKDGCVRCECILSGFVLKQVPEGTLVRHLSQIDLKGSLSASVADFFAFNQTVLIGNIRSVLDDDNKHGANKKVSFLGKLKQRNVTFEELAYICDDSQPKPENGLENLFITTDVTMVNSSGEEHKIPVHSEKEETAKPIARVKEMVQNKLKDATDIKKRHEAFKPGQLTLPAMMLLLVPSVFYYGIAGAPVISAFGFLISFVYVLNYLLKLHLGVAVIRTSTNDMGQMATGSMVVRFPVYLDKISRYLNQKREESGIEITFTHIALKAIAAALDDSTNVHGHVMLGEFFRANTEGVDVSVTVDVANNETATIKVKDANLKGVDYLADELAKRSEQLKSGPSLTFSNKAKLLGLFPHMVRKYLDNMLNFIGSQLGIDIPFLGVVAYPLGCATLITSQLSGEQVDVGDVDTDMTMVSVMSTYSSAPIMVAIGGVRILTSINQENGAMSGVPVLTVSVTVDSKAGTLKEIRKYCSIVQQYMNAPAMLDKVDRKKAVEEENKRMLVERERKNANKYKTK